MQHSTGSFVSPIFALFGSFQTFSELFFPVSGQISVWRVWCNVIFCLSPSLSGADCLCCYCQPGPALTRRVHMSWRVKGFGVLSHLLTVTPPPSSLLYILYILSLSVTARYLPLPNPWSFWLLPSNLARMRSHTNIDYTLLVIWPFDL